MRILRGFWRSLGFARRPAPLEGGVETPQDFHGLGDAGFIPRNFWLRTLTKISENPANRVLRSLRGINGGVTENVIQQGGTDG